MDLTAVVETLRNHRWAILITLVAGLLFALAADKRVQASYTANASVLMVPVATTNDGAPTSTTPLQSADLPMLAQTTNVLDRVSDDLGSSLSPQTLYGRIRTDVYQNSNVMSIRFSDTNPQQAVNGANAVADEVVKYYRSIATSRFDSLAADIKRQLTVRQRELERIDSKLQAMTAAYPYIDNGAGSSDATSMNARLVRLESERDDLLATANGDAAQAGVTAQRTSEATPRAVAEVESSDPTYKAESEQYGRDAADLRRNQTRFSSNYPGLPELQDIVNREKAGLSGDEQRIASTSLSGTQAYSDALAEENRARSTLAADQAKLKQISDTIGELQNELTGSSLRATAAAALRRQRASAESAYQLLSARLITTLADRAAAASTGSLMVFDRASYSTRSPYSEPVVITAAVMMVAVWIAVALAFILEAIEPRFRTPATIESVYSSPVLGVIGLEDN